MDKKQNTKTENENLDGLNISLESLKHLVKEECDDILGEDREELGISEIKALAEEIKAQTAMEEAYNNPMQMDLFLDMPKPKEQLSAIEQAITKTEPKPKKKTKVKKEDILPKKEEEPILQEKPQENKARAKFILFGKKTKEEPRTQASQEEINFFASQSTSQILEQLPLPSKPAVKSKTATQKTQEKIRAFFQKNQSVPTAYVYYAIFPSALEREQFIIEKNVNFVKLFVWDGEANVAFSVLDHEVYEVQSQEEIKILRGEWDWKLNAYAKADRFLQNFDGLCKNFGKSPDHKVTQAKLKEWHDSLTKRTVINYEKLEEYQKFLDEHQSNNRAVYEDSKNDFKECQKARKNIGSFLKKL